MQAGFDRRKSLAALLALVAVTAASAAPTVTGCGDAYPPCRSPAYISYRITVAEESFSSSEFVNSNLARVGQELLAPPAGSGETQTLAGDVKPLPPIPAAVLMVITGCFWVSLVKDRRRWFAALTGLLSLGQAGVSAFPELAYHLAGRKQTQHHSPHSLTRRMRTGEYSRRSRSDVEGTQYIGLLRRLAGIPDERTSLALPESTLPMRTTPADFNSPAARKRSAHFRDIGCAATGLISHLTNITRRAGSLSGEPFVFSPGFIFSNLARGPPPPA